MSTSRLVRLLKLANLLQSGRPVTGQELAVTLGCCKRTVLRDIRVLQESGICVRYSRKHGVYAVDSQPPRKRPFPDEDEYVAMLVAASVSPLMQTNVFADRISQSIAKLMMNAPESTRAKVTNLLASIVLEGCVPDYCKLDESMFKMIIDAFREREQLRVYYRMTEKEQIQCTKTSPYQLVLSLTGWTLIARSSVHRRVVQFNLGAIERVVPVGDAYSTPFYYLQSGQFRSNNSHVPPSHVMREGGGVQPKVP